MRNLTCLLAVLLTLTTCRAAPAPFPKAAPRPPHYPTYHLAGRYTLWWGQCPYRVTLSPCGAYRAASASGVWSGSWSLDGGVLTIRERQEGWVAGVHATYSARLDSCLRGEMTGGQTIWLWPAEK